MPNTVQPSEQEHSNKPPIGVFVPSRPSIGSWPAWLCHPLLRCAYAPPTCVHLGRSGSGIPERKKLKVGEERRKYGGKTFLALDGWLERGGESRRESSRVRPISSPHDEDDDDDAVGSWPPEEEARPEGCEVHTSIPTLSLSSLSLPSPVRSPLSLSSWFSLSLPLSL